MDPDKILDGSAVDILDREILYPGMVAQEGDHHSLRRTWKKEKKFSNLIQTQIVYILST